MDWFMDPVFKAIFRQAEQTDARLGIRRDEKHEGGSRKQPERKDSSEEEAFDEARPVVSVAALVAFLEGLVQTLRRKAPSPPTPDFVVPAVLPPRETASRSDEWGKGAAAPAHAASVYKSVAGGMSSHPEDAGDSGGASLPLSGQTEALSVEDVRAILVLLEKLKALRAETLTIEKAPTFLQSLSNAVERAKEAEG